MSKIRKVDAGLGDLYFFPDEGKDLTDVTVTVQWGPYQNGQLKFITAPFKPAVGGYFINPVMYPGRTHAKDAKEAKRIAGELFSHSLHCLRLDHDKCVTKYDAHLANPTDWPEAPKCECECHK